MKLSHIRITKPKGFDLLRTASGKITLTTDHGYDESYDFMARQYKDHKGGQRGAWPTRWYVGVEIDVSSGLKTAIARRLNWLLSHCRFCKHSYNATECFHCRYVSGGCRVGKCKPYWS